MPVTQVVNKKGASITDALLNMLGVTVVVTDQNLRKQERIIFKRKSAKPSKIKALRNFLVEISGIEPLTS